MASLVQCALIFLILLMDGHESTVSITYPVIKDTSGSCWLTNFIFESSASFKLTENCTTLHLENVTIMESTQERFDEITDGLNSLTVHGCSMESIFLPQNLTTFRFFGTRECRTQIIVDENNNHGLQEIELVVMPKLPVNVDKLRSLKVFRCSRIHKEHFNFTAFDGMEQLEEIEIAQLAGATIPDSAQLPSVRVLKIEDTPITSFASAASKFPNLQVLHLHSNDLHLATEHLSPLTNLTQLSVTNNTLPNLALDAFVTMTQLEVLYLTDNHIAAITTQNVVELPRLHKFALDENNLTELDTTRWVMPALCYLSLNKNRLKQVPGLVALVNTENWKIVFIYDNPWDPEWLDAAKQQINDTWRLFASNPSSYELVTN